MSFDLKFFSEGNVSEKVLDDLKNKSNIESHKTQDTSLFTYKNDVTGVVFQMEYNPAENKKVDDLWDTGIIAYLNYARPTFFALEALGFVAEMCETHKLFAQNLQAKQESAQAFNEANLLKSWVANNQAGIKGHEGSLQIISETSSDYFWSYMRDKEKIETNLKEDVFVPSLMPFARKNDKHIHLAISWIDAIPFVLPKCDDIIILKTEKKLFGLKEEAVIKGTVEYADLFTEINKHISPDKLKETSETYIFHENQTEVLEEIFNGLKIHPNDLQRTDWEGVVESNR